MKRMSDSVRTRLNLMIAAAVAFAFGLGLASALDLTPVSVAADGRRGPEWVIGAPGGATVSMASGFAEVAARVAPAVVTVYAEEEREVRNAALPFRLPPGFERPEGDEEDDQQDPEQDQPRTRIDNWSGSGFVISADGYVVTNNHVVESADRIDLELSDGRRFNDVELVGRDPQTDVALLKINADDLGVIPIGSSDDADVGEWVLAIGSPGFTGARPNTLHTSVTAGIVSAKGRSINSLADRVRNPLAIEDFIQTDAVINRGNSGGPLVNVAGEVIGINTAIFSTTGLYQGYGFAIPIELAREVVDDLIEFGEVRRALIGVAITDVTAADAQFYELDRVAGALVGSFSFDDSPARLAGMDVGDVIVGVEGDPISGVSELQRRIRAYEPGETVTLDIVRRSTKEHETARVKLIPAESSGAVLAAAPLTEPLESTGDALGIEVRDLDELSRSERRRYRVTPDLEGVLIVDGDRRGAIGRLFGGIPEGWVISDINGEDIESVEDYDRVVSRLDPGEAVSVIFLRPVGTEWANQIRSVVIPER